MQERSDLMTPGKTKQIDVMVDKVDSSEAIGSDDEMQRAKADRKKK